MSLKIVNEYITEVLQFDRYLKRAMLNSEPIEEPVPAEEVKPDPDSEVEKEKNLALLQKLGANVDPRRITN